MKGSGLLALWLLAGCTPEMGNPASLITGERIIAVRAEPAEAGPGDMVQYTSLAASPAGTAQTPDLLWSLCNLREPVAENTPVSQACLTQDLPPSGQGGQVAIQTPSAACVNFGPLAPPSGSGALRPTDPDATGGYYQPIRLDLGLDQVVFRERLRCDPAGASLLLSQEFRARYTTNRNPTLVSLSGMVDGTAVSLDSIPEGRRIDLVATWSDDSAEVYPVFDASSQTLVDHREALWLSWYITAGAFGDSTTGRADDDPATWTENRWQSPTTPGPVTLWLVLHDSRGGVDFAFSTLTVVP